MKNNIEYSQGYSDSKGLKIAREAVIGYYKGKKVNNLVLDDIFIGNGVSELITMSMNALLNENDEIFALGFLKSKHILFINGTGFNWKEQNHFRLVYLADCNKLKYATDSLKFFLWIYTKK